MRRRLALAICLAVGLVAGPTVAAEAAPVYSPGAPGIGDPYFPLDGNGGYEVKSYALDLSYDPDSDVLAGTAVLQARSLQNLSTFNLDFQGLNVRAIEVNHKAATWTRSGGELTVTPRGGVPRNSSFRVAVTYDGVPDEIEGGTAGFIATDDGAVVVGQPDVAATWFPANDHPSDKASFDMKLTAPTGLEVVANGRLRWTDDNDDGTTTWRWQATDPMATYLATMNIGEFETKAYLQDGIRYYDAIDPDLFVGPAPRTGERFALSQSADLTYKRLARTISVPAEGATLSFWVTRDTEANWDFSFVEAHTVDQDDWTTLPDLNGHTSDDTGSVCPYWLGLHPFLEHYQTDNGDGTCSPIGTTGSWNAASGASDGYEEWTVDLSAYAGSDVEVAIAYASDDLFNFTGLFVDDVTVSTGEGTTSFEEDGDPLDGWAVLGAPEGSEPNANDWVTGTAEDGPPTLGDIARGSLDREPEIVEFLSSQFGAYPWTESGGIVDDNDNIGFALETQTRPVYSKAFFSDSASGDSVVVHELAHQWFGDALAVQTWSQIWLNEGFATYAEWLWSEYDGLGTAQENFDFYYDEVWADDDPFWDVIIGDPGPDSLFDNAVYYRGAMTLHQLRLTVGDDAFFRTLQRWYLRHDGGNVTIDQFIDLAERTSGQQLDDFFQTWLFTPGKPAVEGAAASATPDAGEASPFAATSGPSVVPPLRVPTLRK